VGFVIESACIEASPRWRTLLWWFADHGALQSPGCRVRQDELAGEVGVPRRSLVRLVQRMEDVGVLQVRRTTIDGAFGSPRGPNYYRLLMGPEEWEGCAEAVVSRRVEETRRRRSSAQRLARARESVARRVPRSSTLNPAGVLSESEVAVLAEEYADLSDDELSGW
jgi:hypothetical protein